MKSMAMRREIQAFSGRGGALAATATVASVPTVKSGVLFAGNSELIIAHGLEFYRLRLTRQNRLILTK
jgi:hemin uptake protein HemP